MSQSVTDTVVEFELSSIDMYTMMTWVFTLKDETYWVEKDVNGRVIGMSFKYPEDATAFKLACRIV